jgi:hypothetical protein
MTNDEVRAARAAYMREYRKRRPEVVRAAQERYWIRKAEALRAGAEKEADTNGGTEV